MSNNDSRGTITNLSIQMLYEYKINDSKIERDIDSDKQVDFKIDGKIIDIFNVVAKLVSFESNQNKAFLKFEDNGFETDFIQNRKIEEKNITTIEDLKVGSYYNFFVNMKHYKTTNYYIFNIKEVEDFSLYTFFLLSVIRDRKERLSKLKDSNIIENNYFTNENDKKDLDENSKQKILDTINSICNNNDNSCSFDDLKNKLAEFSEVDLMKKIESLMDDGFIYMENGNYLINK